MSSIAERLRRHRVAAGHSQERLGYLAGLSSGTVYRLENDYGEPHTDTVLKLARALDVSMQSFIEDTSADYELEARISLFRSQLDAWGAPGR
jgi:transcriptional regulator with XRE-family HTH domain